MRRLRWAIREVRIGWHEGRMLALQRAFTKHAQAARQIKGKTLTVEPWQGVVLRGQGLDPTKVQRLLNEVARIERRKSTDLTKQPDDLAEQA